MWRYLGCLYDKFQNKFDLSKYRFKTISALSNNKGVQALFILEDKIRPLAKETIKQLQKMDIKKMAILSGDNDLSVQKVAQSLGIKKYLSNLPAK